MSTVSDAKYVELFTVFIMFGSFGKSILFSKKKSVLSTLCRVYNIGSGMFQAPLYAFLQTMLAELTPPGFDYVVCL